jgi:hypothetical protein
MKIFIRSKEELVEKAFHIAYWNYAIIVDGRAPVLM